MITASVLKELSERKFLFTFMMRYSWFVTVIVFISLLVINFDWSKSLSSFCTFPLSTCWHAMNFRLVPPIPTKVGSRLYSAVFIGIFVELFLGKVLCRICCWSSFCQVSPYSLVELQFLVVSLATPMNIEHPS